LSRYLTVLVGSLGLVAGSLALTAPPASAANSTGTLRTLDPQSAIYIDAKDPQAQVGSGSSDLPVGAWRDDAGRHHIARMLVTFDISSYQGTKIQSATVFTKETAANHCPDRSLDLWSTDAVTPDTSWANPPTERQFIGNIGATPAGCPAVYLGWDGTAAVTSAVTAGRSTLTLEFRVPDANEGDIAYGRRLVADVRIQIHSDAAPDTPTQLRNGGQSCVTGAPYPYLPGLGEFQLAAKVTDPDTNGGDQVDAHFAIWPVAHPDQRTELVYTSALSGSTPAVRVPAGYLADGVSYGWTVRADDGIFSSDWAAPCYFTADLVAPVPPTVTSTDYPSDNTTHGGAGIPGTFTFSANGSTDVVSYLYAWNTSYGPFQSVSPATIGGDVTLTLTPPANGIDSLTVISVDRSGLQSGSTRYDIRVAWTSPSVSVVWPLAQSNSGAFINPGPGMSGTFTFRPTMTNVVSYEYWLDAGDHHTVAAAADGTAQAVVPDGGLGYHTIHVRSVTGTGVTSGIADLSYIVDDVPIVSSTDYPENDAAGGAGIPGIFTFTPKSLGVVGWAYLLNWGDLQTVDAGPDGTGTLQWTPDSDGYMVLTVFAMYADGTYSAEYDYYFNVGPW
jgi:hypothetical protein